MNHRAGRSLRLRHTLDIRRVFTEGVALADARMTLRALHRPGQTPQAPARVAVAVSPRHGKAVRRNRVKRLCREAFRLVRPDVPDGWDFVIIPRPGADLSLEGLKDSIRRLTRRAVQKRAPEAPP